MKKKILKIGIRVVITAGLLAAIVMTVDLEKAWANVKQADWVTALAFAPLMALSIVAVGIRWGLVMKVAKVPATFRGAIAVVYTGIFINQFSIGAAGGDIARAVLASRGSDMKARTVGTILFDRAIGLVTLITIGLVTALLNLKDPRYEDFAWVSGGMAGAIALGSLVYFNPWLRRLAPGKWLKRKMPGAGMIRDMDFVFKEMIRHPGVLAICVATTVIGQASSILAIWGFSTALGLNVTVGECFASMPIVIVVMALPISIGGLGTGEAAFQETFMRMGLTADQALSIAILYRFMMLIVSLPGIVIFALGRARTHKPPDESE